MPEYIIIKQVEKSQGEKDISKCFCSPGQKDVYKYKCTCGQEIHYLSERKPVRFQKCFNCGREFEKGEL